MTAYMTKSERIAKRIGEQARAAWIIESGSAPLTIDWHEDDYVQFATDRLVDHLDPEEFEEEGITFGDVIEKFREGFYGL